MARRRSKVHSSKRDKEKTDECQANDSHQQKRYSSALE